MKNAHILVIWAICIWTVISCSSKSVQEPPVLENLIINGSFEEVKGDTIVGWENVDTFNLSNEALPEGGSLSLNIIATDVIPLPATQRLFIPFSSFGYTFNCYVKVKISGEALGGEGAIIEIETHRGDSSFTVIEESFTDSLWTPVVIENLSFNKGDTVEIKLNARGGKASTSRAYFDLSRLETGG